MLFPSIRLMPAGPDRPHGLPIIVEEVDPNRIVAICTSHDLAEEMLRRCKCFYGLVGALEMMWAFASTMIEKHGMDGDDTLTDDEHAAWQDAAAYANAAMRNAGIAHDFDKVKEPKPA